MKTMTHPNLPGVEITVSDSAAAVHEDSGWVVKTESQPAQPESITPDTGNNEGE